LLGELVLRFVFGGHPHLGGLFHDLLADRMDSRIEFGHGLRALGAIEGLLLEFGVERVKGLHLTSLMHPHHPEHEGSHVPNGCRDRLSGPQSSGSRPISVAERCGAEIVCFDRFDQSMSPSTTMTRQKRYTAPENTSQPATASGIPTRSTASQTNQNSTTARPWAYMATTEPMKMQATGPGFHDNQPTAQIQLKPLEHT